MEHTPGKRIVTARNPGQLLQRIARETELEQSVRKDLIRFLNNDVRNVLRGKPLYENERLLIVSVLNYILMMDRSIGLARTTHPRLPLTSKAFYGNLYQSLLSAADLLADITNPGIAYDTLIALSRAVLEPGTCPPGYRLMVERMLNLAIVFMEDDETILVF